MRGLPTAPESVTLSLDDTTVTRVAGGGNEVMFQAKSAELVGRMIEGSVAKRAGTPDEVGAVAALLMGTDGGFIVLVDRSYADYVQALLDRVAFGLEGRANPSDSVTVAGCCGTS